MREGELLLSFFWDHGSKLLRLLIENPSWFILGFQQSRQHFTLLLPSTEDRINWNTFTSPVLHLYHSQERTYLPYMPQTAFVPLSMKFLLMTLAFLINFFIPQNNPLRQCCLSSFLSHPFFIFCFTFICSPHSLPLRKTLNKPSWIHSFQGQ